MKKASHMCEAFIKGSVAQFFRALDALFAGGMQDVGQPVLLEGLDSFDGRAAFGADLINEGRDRTAGIALQ